jgi:hypothetical protein
MIPGTLTQMGMRVINPRIAMYACPSVVLCRAWLVYETATPRRRWWSWCLAWSEAAAARMSPACGNPVVSRVCRACLGGSWERAWMRL